MIAKIIELSIKNKFLVILATLFVIAGGLVAITRIPLDAIPDLSDVQVIILTEYAGQAPQVVEDQVTYPLTTAMLSVPFAKVVRGFSFFGISFVYVIFEDGTDMYWARSRVLEYLNYVSGRLPAGVTPTLGPDATGVGWVYAYTLESDEWVNIQVDAIDSYAMDRVEFFLDGTPIGFTTVAPFTKKWTIALSDTIPALSIDPAVIIIASKNVPAPGPGAAAYSVAKAGLTQLARVAALELGPSGIRVNIIHPHAVFDTALWTTEVLEKRARHYEMTVDEYKTNNLLKMEITSENVARLACAMAGPAFAATTGAQVPIDGGSDRVI